MPVAIRVLLIGTGVFIAGCLPILSGGAFAQHTRTITRTVDLDPEGEVEVLTRTGGIEVSAWDRASAELEVRVEGEEADPVQNLGIEIDDGQDQLTIATENADSDGPGFWDLIGFGSTDGPATYVSLQIPSTATLSVTTKDATVEVTGLKTEVSVQGTASSVKLRNLEGEIQVGTSSGSITGENLQGQFRAGTFSGTVQLRASTAPPETQIGSFSGDAEIILPADAGFDLVADVSWGGEIVSDFDLPDGYTETPVSVGGGGPQITFGSFSGDLTLRAE